MQKNLSFFLLLLSQIPTLQAAPLATLLGIFRGRQRVLVLGLREAKGLFHPSVVQAMPPISAYGEVFLVPVLESDTPFVATLKKNLEFPENFEKCVFNREFSSENTHAINAMLDYCYKSDPQKKILKDLIFGSSKVAKRSLVIPSFYYQVINAFIQNDHAFIDAVNAGYAKDCRR